MRRDSVSLAAGLLLALATMLPAARPAAATTVTGCAAEAGNLVLNCSFENGLDSWSVSDASHSGVVDGPVPDSYGGWVDAYDGSFVFAAATSPSGGEVVSLTQSITPAAGTWYRASFEYMGGNDRFGNAWLQAVIDRGSGVYTALAYVPEGGGYSPAWTEQTGFFEGTGAPVTLTFSWQDPVADEHFYIDDISVVPVSAPGAPTLVPPLATNSYGGGVVELNWTAPDNDGGSPILGYNVYVRSETDASYDYSSPWNGGAPVPDSYYDVSPLANGQPYCFEVTAVNGAGESEPSDELCGAPLGPPSAPTLTDAVGGDGQITLTWTPPDNDGGSAISFYQYDRTTFDGTSCNDNGWYLDTLTTDGTATIASFTAVTNGQAACVRIAAVNDSGAGDWSNIMTATPLGKPSAVTLSLEAVGNGTISVAWSAPSSTGGSDITGYNLKVGTAAGGESKIGADPLDPATFAFDGAYHYTLNSLKTDGTSYWLCVDAENSVGEGPCSNEISAVPILAPGAPTGAHATATVTKKTASMSVSLTWTEPAASAGINDHMVSVYSYHKGTKRTPATYALVTSYETNASAASYTINTGLSSRGTYAFTVKAGNAAGWGSESGYSNVVP